MTVLVSGLALIGAFGLVAAGSAGLVIALYRVTGKTSGEADGDT